MFSMNNKICNAIRMLGVDMIANANSGHPGIVLGAAPIAYTLFSRHLKIDANNKDWINRDRFVLSAGHGSALLYTMLHLMGYEVTIDDLKNFRSLKGVAGHPEYRHTSGVEMTTGPLGQGIASAVGMAIAESHLANKYNTDSHKIIDHNTYVLCGDGDLQEGVAMEAISLAGHLGLGKLIVLYDSNDIQLDGPVSLTVTENTKKKFESQNWHYIKVSDDIDEIDKAIRKAKNILDKPTIIEIKTVIGYGSPAAGTSKVHGTPIKGENLESLKKALSWEYPPFSIPAEVIEHFLDIKKKKYRAFLKWNKTFKEYASIEMDKVKELGEALNGIFGINCSSFSDLLNSDRESGRSSGGKVLNILSARYQNLMGGSADLTSSTNVKGADGNYTKETPLGRNINFGVREHAMGAICNGLVLHGGIKAFTGAFFVFSDYMKPAIRLAALMQIPSVFIFTHDSIAVGEDGPTHQPIEQLASFRAIPNLNVMRVADTSEVICAYKEAFENRSTPSLIVLTRQDVKNYNKCTPEYFSKGAYIISPENGKLDGVIIATGSEVELAINVQKALEIDGISIRVVSMPSQYLFDKQSAEYKNYIIPKKTLTMSLEMGSTFGWHKYTNNPYGIDRFGLSDKMNVVLSTLGFEVKKVKEFFLSIYK